MRSMKAGANGLQGVRGLFARAARSSRAGGAEHVRRRASPFPDQGVTPSLQPGVVVNLNEIQWTPLTDPVPGKSYRRSTALSRLIWGKNAQISLVRMDPQSEIALHIHPEDQLTHTIRGTLDQGVMDRIVSRVRRGGPHAATCPAAWCTRQSSATSAPISSMSSGRCGRITSSARRSSRRSTSRSSRPEAKPKKLAEGFTFTEGPTWLKGKLYFSDMCFKNPAANDWTGSPARSRLIVDGAGRQVARAVERHAVERHARGDERQPASSATCSATASSKWIRRPDASCASCSTRSTASRSTARTIS